MSKLNSNNKNYILKETKKIWAPPVNKILIIITIILFLIIISINPVLNGIVKPKILNPVNQNKNINVKIGYIGYNVFTQKLSIESTQVILKDSTSGDSTKFQIPNCEVSDFKMFKLILGNGLSFENIVINHPHLFINRSSGGNEKDPKTKNKKNSNDNELLSFLPKKLKPFSFEKISINNLTLSQVINNKEYHDSVKKIFVSAEGLKLDSSVIEDTLSLKFASSLHIFVEGFSYHFDDNYLLKFDTLSSSSSDSVFIIKGISYKPYLSDADFFNHRRFRSDRYIIKVPFISANGINFKKFNLER